MIDEQILDDELEYLINTTEEQNTLMDLRKKFHLQKIGIKKIKCNGFKSSIIKKINLLETNILPLLSANITPTEISNQRTKNSYYLAKDALQICRQIRKDVIVRSLKNKAIKIKQR